MRLPLGISYPRLLFALIGFAPIVTLAAALFGWVPLHVSAKFVVLPAIAGAIVLGLTHRAWGRLALVGFLAGVVATGGYDATRLALVWLGVWPDFIPAIGQMAMLDDGAHPAWGYFWRFVGNGGGMGVTFAMLLCGPHAERGRLGSRTGMAYGTFICFCLFGTLLLAPGAQERLFPLTPVTVAAALLGHLDYGLLLGWLTRMWLPKPATSAERRVPPAAETSEVGAEALP